MDVVGTASAGITTDHAHKSLLGASGLAVERVNDRDDELEAFC